MEEALHLDGVQFADEGMVGVEEVGAGAGGLHYMVEEDMMMDTGADEIVGLGMDGEYEVGAGGDMPALGGEEEVLTLQPPVADRPHYTVNADAELERLVRSVKQEYVTLSQAPLYAPPEPPPPPPPRPPVKMQTIVRPVQVTQGGRAAGGVREVAIAPKPPAAALPWAGAAKLVPLGKGGVVKKVAISGVVQAGKGPGTVLGQLGKQKVMVVAGTGGPGRRLKLLAAPPASAASAASAPASASAAPTVHYVKTKTEPQGAAAGSGNPLLTKMLVQSSGVELVAAPSVVAKLAGGGARYYTLQQQGSPGKWSAQPMVAVGKPRAPPGLALASPAPKLTPINVQGGGGGRKYVISSAGGAAPGVVLRAVGAAPAAAAPAVPAPAASSQLHQIHVPGKGVQYIRLVTTPGQRARPAAASAAPAAPAAPAAANATTLLLPEAQAPPKPPQKLVRIAPVDPAKPHALLAAPASVRTVGRSAQSLLAPRSPAVRRAPAPSTAPAPTPPPPDEEPAEEGDSKAALRALVRDASRRRSIEYNAPEEASSLELPSFSAQEAEAVAEGAEAAAGAEGEGAAEGGDDDYVEYESALAASYLQRQQELEVELAQSARDVLRGDQDAGVEMALRPRKACNCTKSQCLKLYCDCFAGGEFCNRCNCTNCHNNLDNEELRQKAIRNCLERNPNAFRPKIGKGRSAVGPEPVRRHNKGCNCKRSGCLKNYCECYEAKIACSAICRCVGCRNVEESAERARRADSGWGDELPALSGLAAYRPPPLSPHSKQPCSFMTSEVIEAVCQCLLAAAAGGGEAASAGGGEGERGEGEEEGSRVPAVLEEFSRCLQDIIGAAHHAHRPDALANSA